MAASSARRNSVFLNIPFDKGYESQFVALLASIIAIGRTPRCVLEIPEVGSGRLTRLLELITSCEASVHDLSRVGVPARFNMPFELGLACAVSRVKGNHAFVLLEKRPFRLQQTLSDMNGHDPFVHGGSIHGTIGCVLDALRPRTGAPAPVKVFGLYQTMRVAGNALKSGATDTLFSRSKFLDLVAIGVERARQTGMLLA